jgi:uncharacterized protein YciI
MLFAIICHDKPNQAETRARHRDAHLSYLDGFTDRMLSVGPLLAEDMSHSVGSLLVMDFADRAEAEAFCSNDPFNRAGIFESVVIRPYKQLLPTKA